MRLGFLIGVVLTAWLTMNYPAEARSLFEKVKSAGLVFLSNDPADATPGAPEPLKNGQEGTQNMIAPPAGE